MPMVVKMQPLTVPEPYTPLMAAVSMTLTVLVSPAIRTSVGLQPAVRGRVSAPVIMQSD